MSWRALRALVLGAVVLFLPVSCSVVVDTEELQAGAAGLNCAEDEKICPDRLATDRDTCVSKNLAGYGCGASSCAPCMFADATAYCDNDYKCALGPCLGRYKDCNEEPDDGCEADLDRDERNCGACDNQCRAENGVTACSQGECTIVFCSEPFRDCDERFSTGCESDVRTSLQHCGGCGRPCAGSCEDGVCNP